MTIACFAPISQVPSGARLARYELARRDRLVRSDSRAAYTAAHLLVRHCAARLLNCSVNELTVQQRCDSCGSAEHGRPRLAGEPQTYLSLSHTRGWVAAVASTRPCGIDIELEAESIPWRTLSVAEADWVRQHASPHTAFTQLWVCKEATFKTGTTSGADTSKWLLLTS